MEFGPTEDIALGVQYLRPAQNLVTIATFPFKNNLATALEIAELRE
jgi:hypothetical protein